jgi:hypothetical protein
MMVIQSRDNGENPMSKEQGNRSIRLGIVIEALQYEEREKCAKLADAFAFGGATPKQPALEIYCPGKEGGEARSVSQPSLE